MGISRQNNACVRDGCGLPEARPAHLSTFQADRCGRVRAVRRQLRHGEYDIDSRLAAIIDRILEDLLR